MNGKGDLSAELKEITFNRQFLLCDKEILMPKDWQIHKIGSELILYSHPNLSVCQSSISDRKLTLIGELYDTENPDLTNDQILGQLAENTTFEGVLEATFSLAGKFILIYSDNDHLKLFHDAVGLREVFYAKDTPNTPCASQPTLFTKYKKLNLSSNALANKYYGSQAFQNRKERIGETTQYEGLLHLQPNCYLDLKQGRAFRFFPQNQLPTIELKEAVSTTVSYLKGVFSAMANRHPLMIAVTAGMDSRIMLAASQHVRDKAYYFVLHSDALKEDSLDITTPRKLLGKMGLPFHVIKEGEEVDDEIKQTMLENVELMLDRHVNFWYNVFYQKKEFLNITSVSEFARNYYHYEADHKSLTGKKLATINKHSNNFVSNVYDLWLNENQDCFQQNGYNVLDMFYWEEKMGNWLANGRSSMSSVIEDFSPFNCRNLMMTFLSVNKKFRGRYDSVFHNKIIESLCPDALQEPINGSRKYQLIKTLNKLGIYPLYKRVQLKLRR